jgi:hypothetical protein
MISGYKTLARAALHDAMAEPASYSDDTPGAITYPTPEQTEAGLSLTVRWHNKMRIVGERSQDDAGIIEGINRLVFQKPQLEALGITLKRVGVVTIPGLEKAFRLEYHEESDGPLNDYWTVVEL